MELKHIVGRTWVAEGSTALLPVYFLTDRDIVLIDTGYARLDRTGLAHLIDDNGLCLRGVICSHAHFDHTGNVRYLQQRCGCLPPSSSSRRASPSTPTATAPTMWR